MIRRLFRWIRGYTVEQWRHEERVDGHAIYSYPLTRVQIEAHFLNANTLGVDPHWHYLVMTERFGHRKFYIDGAEWPTPTEFEVARRMVER